MLLKVSIRRRNVALVIIETVVNCFCKAGIFAENQDAAIAEEDNPFKDLQDEIDALRTVQPGSYSRGYRRSFVSRYTDKMPWEK